MKRIFIVQHIGKDSKKKPLYNLQIMHELIIESARYIICWEYVQKNMETDDFYIEIPPIAQRIHVRSYDEMLESFRKSAEDDT